jgi:porin
MFDKSQLRNVRNSLKQGADMKINTCLNRMRTAKVRQRFWKLRTRAVYAAVLLLLCVTGLFAQSTDQSNNGWGWSNLETRSHFFGDWGGRRSKLAAEGVTFDFFYVADLQANPVGGLRQTDVGWGRIRGTMDVDFGKLADWNGLTFHATGLWQFGGNLGAEIGVLANPSGLVSAHTTRLDSFWLQQALFHNRVLLRVGQFAGLDFYGNQEYGASFLIEPLDYAFGNLFPTTYESFNPAGTPAAQIQVFLWRTLYIKTAVLSGNRNPYQQDGSGFNFQIRNSPDFVSEIGFSHDLQDLNAQVSHVDYETYPGIYKFGSAYNDGKFTNAAGIQSRGNYLIYGSVNQAVYRSDVGSNRGLDTTVGFDWSPNDVNRENSTITAGARYNGPIPSRPQDAVAVGFVYTHIGDPFQSVGLPLGAPPLLGTEKAIELNYALQITPYFLFQPVYQEYIDVGGNSHIPNAAVFGFRTKIDF